MSDRKKTSENKREGTLSFSLIDGNEDDCYCDSELWERWSIQNGLILPKLTGSSDEDEKPGPKKPATPAVKPAAKKEESSSDSDSDSDEEPAKPAPKVTAKPAEKKKESSSDDSDSSEDDEPLSKRRRQSRPLPASPRGDFPSEPTRRRPRCPRCLRCPTHLVRPEDEWSSVSCWQEGL